jgi:streptogramin lyase
MRAPGLLILVTIVLLLSLFGAPPGTLEGQGAAPVALSGVVSASEEGRMEGVVVTARRNGATFTVSVVSNAQGVYSFPRTHLEPGAYDLTIRAVGYDLISSGRAEVTANAPAMLDLKLQKTADLGSQLSSHEWLMSMPGTTDQKDKLAYQVVSCAYCHTYERIVKSRHTAEQFVAVITRMQTYFGDGTAVSRSGRGRGQRSEHPEGAAQNPNWGTVPKTELAAYLASVNLNGGKTTWPYALKTLPRPAGLATRVIITQYDLPRRDTVPHDMTIDSRGTPWYPDQSRMFIGKLDPKTGIATEYPLPPLPPGRVGGVADMQVDKEDNVWFTMTVPERSSHFGFPAKFDPRTKDLTVVPLPSTGSARFGDGSAQFLDLAPDGTLWMNSGVDFYRVDPKTMMVDRHFDATPKDSPAARHFVYQIVVDSTGTPYGTDFPASYIVRVDTDAGKVRYWPTLTPNALPRRGRMDRQDRFWFAEYFGDRIGMFDTRTEQMHEFPLPRKYTTPYTASAPDKNGYLYAPSNMTERLMRLDPKTGQVIEYQMPTDFDTKKTVHDPSTDRTTLWMANTRNARLIRVEPLE